MSKYLFTSESVTKGHPDKLCDQISDAVLDAILTNDPDARVACETACTTGVVWVMGEISTSCYVDIPKVVRDTVRAAGYDGRDGIFNADACAVLTAIDEQSADIAMGVDRALEVKERENDEDRYDLIGAGDQGMMFGFACDETSELMPLPISLAHKLALRLTEVRENGTLPFLRPDGKTQVTVEYENGIPVRVDTVVVSTQHAADVSLDVIRREVIAQVINPVIPAALAKDMKIFVNPTGRFVTGGPQGDSGLTGRKIIVDTYGGAAAHGGGAFSGKDPTKVDRTAAYMARYIAKNIVAAGLAHRCEVQLAYAIGVAHPVSVNVNTFGTGTLDADTYEKLVREHFDLRPAAMIDKLGLRRPIYTKLAAYGHMGREELGVQWEKTDVAEALRAAAKR